MSAEWVGGESEFYKRWFYLDNVEGIQTVLLGTVEYVKGDYPFETRDSNQVVITRYATLEAAKHTTSRKMVRTTFARCVSGKTTRSKHFIPIGPLAQITSH